MQLKVGGNIYYIYGDGTIIVGTITSLDDSMVYIRWDGATTPWAYDLNRESFWEYVVADCVA